MWTMLHSVLAGATLAAGMGTAMLWAAAAPDARQPLSDNPVRVLSAAARTTDPGTVVFGPPPGSGWRIHQVMMRDPATPALREGVCL